jgi:thymidylate synthase
MYIADNTLDDLLRSAIERLLQRGRTIRPSKGPALELAGVLLKLSNPRARLSRTDKKGTVFSCLGETLWYMARTNRLAFIEYYLIHYRQYSDDLVTLYGAYGPRLFRMRGIDQLANVIRKLRDERDTRQAVVQLFDARDIVAEHKDVPCTCTLQFMRREGRLHMVTFMRSNDVFVGLPHDVFAFTMVQEYVARSIGVTLGTYTHMVGSLHLYNKDLKRATAYLDEGFQPTTRVMPPMPNDDPHPALARLLKAERELRTNGRTRVEEQDLDHYWADLLRLLKIYAYFLKEDRNAIRELKAQMHSRIYDIYIDKKLNRRKKPRTPQ